MSFDAYCLLFFFAGTSFNEIIDILHFFKLGVGRSFKILMKQYRNALKGPWTGGCWGDLQVLNCFILVMKSGTDHIWMMFPVVPLQSGTILYQIAYHIVFGGWCWWITGRVFFTWLRGKHSESFVTNCFVLSTVLDRSVRWKSNILTHAVQLQKLLADMFRKFA